jgi:hypothetical protein
VLPLLLLLIIQHTACCLHTPLVTASVNQPRTASLQQLAGTAGHGLRGWPWALAYLTSWLQVCRTDSCQPICPQPTCDFRSLQNRQYTLSRRFPEHKATNQPRCQRQAPPDVTEKSLAALPEAWAGCDHITAHVAEAARD